MRGGFNATPIDPVMDKDFFDPDNKVLVRIVNLFSDKSAVKKTQLQLASKLRWDLFSKYWYWLQEQDFIQSTDINDYTLTPRGSELASLFLKYHEFLHKDRMLQISI